MFTNLSFQTSRRVRGLLFLLILGALVLSSYAPGPGVGSAAAQIADSVAAEDETTLVPGFKSNDPYGWLSGDDSYQLPAEWLQWTLGFFAYPLEKVDFRNHTGVAMVE